MSTYKQTWSTPKLYGVGHFTEFNLYREALLIAKSKGFIDQAWIMDHGSWIRGRFFDPFLTIE